MKLVIYMVILAIVSGTISYYLGAFAEFGYGLPNNIESTGYGSLTGLFSGIIATIIFSCLMNSRYRKGKPLCNKRIGILCGMASALPIHIVLLAQYGLVELGLPIIGLFFGLVTGLILGKIFGLVFMDFFDSPSLGKATGTENTCVSPTGSN